MNPNVSCRQLSPHIALALLLLLILLSMPPVSAATTVQSVGVKADRTDYANVPGYNRVVATATVQFNGAGSLDPVRFQWYAPGASSPFLTGFVPPTQIRAGLAQAVDVWIADREGVGFNVLASINYTLGGPTMVASPPSPFNVYNRTRYVSVTDIVVATSPVYENGTLGTARADVKYSGNSSYLAGGRFDWYYPDWTFAASPGDPSPPPVSVDTAHAFSSWSIDRAGQGLHVNATYLAAPLENTTSFDVLQRLVSNWWPAGNINTNSTMTRSGSPWGICSNVSIDPGAELYIESGVVVRFCKGTGLFVNGTLTGAALPTNRVYLLSLTAVGEPMQAGDWRGVTFFAGAPTNRSLLSNAVIQAVSTGVTIQGTAVMVLNSTVALATGPAVWLTNSASLVGNNAISQVDVGIRADGCAGAVLDSNRIQSARVGVLVKGSDVVLRANEISLAASMGLRAEMSRITIDGGTFRDDGDTAVYLSGVTAAHIDGVSITGGNDSLRGENSRGVGVELSTLAGARYRSAVFINLTSTVVNSTLAALQYDLILVASPTTLVNTTSGAPYIQVNSVITVRNFLHVLVESNLPGRERVSNAWVNVTSDGLTVSSRRTNPSGWSQWILLTDRLILDNTRTRYFVNVVAVRVDGLTVISAPRAVNMSTSHVERFVAVPPDTNTPPFFLGIDGVLLITIAVLMGTVLLVMPVMKRRRASNGNGRARASAAEAVLEPGIAYVVPDEKPDRAFGILAAQVAKGSKGLVVSRIYPDEVRRRYGLKDTPVLWLSRGYGKDTVNPTNLGALVHEIERFASGKEDSIVLLDGLEYLLVQNDPQKIVKFVQTLEDTASVHHTKILIPFDVKSVTEAQRALIMRDLQTL